MTAIVTTTSAKLRAIADLMDAHPELPQPYISAYSTGGVEANWFLYLHGLSKDLSGQKAAAAQLVSTLGGQWAKTEDDDRFTFTQTCDDGLSLSVTVHRAAVCERVVVGSHEVTIPATPAIPKQAARPERTETIEDVKWVCSSLLADQVAA
jgi:hypothetical protein